METNIRGYLLGIGVGASLALSGCATTHTLTVSAASPVAATDDHGVPCLRSGGTNPVTLWLLTPRFRADPEDLAPPAFRVLVKNGGDRSLSFSTADIAASAGGVPVQVLTAAEFAAEIERQAEKLRTLADTNAAQARQKLDELEAIAATATPGTNTGVSGQLYDFSTVQQPATSGAREQIDAAVKTRRAEIEAWRRNMLDDDQQMLGEHAVAPGAMAGGVVRLAPEAVAAARTLKLVVTAGGEHHEFVFDVSR